MPWVSEQEQNDLVDKVNEMRDWIDKKMDEQNKLTLMEDPAFSMDEVDKEMAKVTKLAKKIFGKKKPKEKKEKVIKAEEVNDEEFDNDEATKKEESEAKTDENEKTEQDQEAGYEDEL